jgi:thymidylate synthase
LTLFPERKKMKTVSVVGQSLPECLAEAIKRCWTEGARFRTEYDKPGDPESRDVSLMMHVREPFAEPRIMLCMPGGFGDLATYECEVVAGARDWWVREGKEAYSYHLCIADQVERCVELLRECGHSRRVKLEAWTWSRDLYSKNPPCVQYVWMRIENSRLNMTCHMRSNDAYKAAFMDIYALTQLQRNIAQQADVGVGEYVHFADSFHIYGSYFREVNLERLDAVVPTSQAAEEMGEAVRALLRAEGGKMTGAERVGCEEIAERYERR